MWSRFVLASYLLRTLFGCDTDIVQLLNSYRTDPEQELPGRNLVNSDYQIVELRRWSEHNTNTIRTQPEYIGARGKKKRLVWAKKADWIEKGLIG
ncbi:hypothetical protein [uncultured Sphingobacterium sp.]|uniref:hypothetical protein n=1 Tax=uncultured Sphingobacterium sp. TaxID=182688 RepID=UPI003747FF1C